MSALNNAKKLLSSEPLLQTQIGYRIVDEKAEINKALHAAFELVKKMRRQGSAVRFWAGQTNREINTLLTAGSPTFDINHWETNIMTNLRSYMQISSDLLNHLKSLNPPLTMQHLRPFKEAMDLDRRVTIDALDPLTKTLNQYNATHERDYGVAPAARFYPAG